MFKNALSALCENSLLGPRRSVIFFVLRNITCVEPLPSLHAVVLYLPKRGRTSAEGFENVEILPQKSHNLFQILF